MSNLAIGISHNGAVKLGNQVTCDGFVYGYEYRVQTHVHDDHMSNFDSSKHFQAIIMSEPTRSLLEIKHVEMPHSTNVITHPLNGIREYDGIKIEFKSSSHMLGAVQVSVTTPSGERLGYSGDFSWPLEDVIEVDQLVLDSTYGNPESVRKYTQEEANDAFKEIVGKKIKEGPIIIKGHRGTLYRSLELLNGLVQCPVIASKKKIAEAKVCENYGYCICELTELENPTIRKLRKEGPYIELRYIGEYILYEPGDCTNINLTASWVQGSAPLLKISNSTYNIAVTDHADFLGTLEYIKETGAKVVITDSVRGRNASLLAGAITRKLNIEAYPAKIVRSKAWGV